MLEYYAGIQEAWDGPALLTFCDGKQIGAQRHRNPHPHPTPSPSPNPNPAQVQRDLLEVKHTVAAIAAHLKVDTKPSG